MFPLWDVLRLESLYPHTLNHLLLCSLWCRPVDHAVNCVYSHYGSGKKSLRVQINAHKFIYFSLKCVCARSLSMDVTASLNSPSHKAVPACFSESASMGVNVMRACLSLCACACLRVSSPCAFSKSLFTVWAGNGNMASSVAIRCMYCTCFSSDTSRPTECALQAGMRGIGPAHSSRARARSYQKWSKCGRKDCSWYPPPPPLPPPHPNSCSGVCVCLLLGSPVSELSTYLCLCPYLPPFPSLMLC